jgi:toxin ParE1/3/4
VHDLEEIAAYIHRDSPAAARAFRDRVRKAGAKLDRFPERGRIVPELRDLGVTVWRELILRPYRMMYRIEGSTVVVDLVIDARRDVVDVLFARLLRIG